MSSLTEWLTTTNEGLGYSPGDILLNLCLALAAGLVIGWIYRKTHRGLSYSQSFVITLVMMCITVSAVMMVIGSNLARAFALVGALTIVRFRTVVKDTRDTAFIFFSLTEGIASGTGNWLLAAISTVFISVVAILMARTNYGSISRTEFILRFRYDRSAGGEEDYVRVIGDFSRTSTLIHIEPSDDARYLTLTYDLTLERAVKASSLISSMQKVPGVDRINMVSSTNDIDY